MPMISCGKCSLYFESKDGSPCPECGTVPTFENMFRVGQRVEILAEYDHLDKIGEVATIVSISSDRPIGLDKLVGVEFAEAISWGHTCNGSGQYYHCWWYPPEYLKILM